MTRDDDWYRPHHGAAAETPRQPIPGELLFEFVRAHDHRRIRCELRFNGESYGWEAQYLEDGELVFSHGLFHTKAAAVQWAEQMRPTAEKGSE